MIVVRYCRKYYWLKGDIIELIIQMAVPLGLNEDVGIFEQAMDGKMDTMYLEIIPCEKDKYLIETLLPEININDGITLKDVYTQCKPCRVLKRIQHSIIIMGGTVNIIDFANGMLEANLEKINNYPLQCVMRVRITRDIARDCYLVKFERMIGDCLYFGRIWQQILTMCGDHLTGLPKKYWSNEQRETRRSLVDIEWETEETKQQKEQREQKVKEMGLNKKQLPTRNHEQIMYMMKKDRERKEYYQALMKVCINKDAKIKQKMLDAVCGFLRQEFEIKYEYIIPMDIERLIFEIWDGLKWYVCTAGDYVKVKNKGGYWSRRKVIYYKAKDEGLQSHIRLSKKQEECRNAYEILEGVVVECGGWYYKSEYFFIEAPDVICKCTGFCDNDRHKITPALKNRW